jgi:hypothetical protein
MLLRNKFSEPAREGGYFKCQHIDLLFSGHVTHFCPLKMIGKMLRPLWALPYWHAFVAQLVRAWVQ